MQLAHDDMYHLVGRRGVAGSTTIRSTRYIGAAGLSGNPILIAHANVTALMDDITRHGCWSFVVLHELGHNFEGGAWWTFDTGAHGAPSTREFAANWMVAYVMSRRNATITRYGRIYVGIAGYRQYFYATSGGSYRNVFVHNIWDRNSYAHRFSGNALLYTFLSIEAQIGWEPFRQTFRYFNTLGSSTPPAPIDRVNLFLTRLRDFSGGRDVIGMMNPFSRFYYGLRFGGAGWAIRYV